LFHGLRQMAQPIQDLDYFLERVKSHGFTVTAKKKLDKIFIYIPNTSDKLLKYRKGGVLWKNLKEKSKHVYKMNRLIALSLVRFS
jgi:hypothetical protein